VAAISSAPAGRPTEFVIGGPSGIFGPSSASPVIATDAVARLLEAANRGDRVLDTHYADRREAAAPASAPASAGNLAPRAAMRAGDKNIKLTPHIARIVLGDDQTLNPNAKLLRKLRSQHLIPSPEEMDEPDVSDTGVVEDMAVMDRARLAIRDDREKVERVHLALFGMVIVLLVALGVAGVVWVVRRRRARAVRG
jgi:hypothetical protein